MSSIIHKSSLPATPATTKSDNSFSPFNAIARFLSSNNHNLKYLGLEALYVMDPIWWVENDWWTEEKMRILVDCLEEKDETLKKKVW